MPHLPVLSLSATFCQRKLRFFAIAAVLLGPITAAHGATCPVRTATAPSAAEEAALKGDFDRAASLYREKLVAAPNDEAVTAGLVRVLLRQQKLKDAEDTINKAVASQPKSAVLKVVLAEVQYRQGTPWLASASVDEAIKIDPCQARAHLVAARYLKLSSMYASASAQIVIAHKLDPYDPQISSEWLNTLPTKQRISELEAYLDRPTGDSPEELKHLHSYLDELKQEVEQPRKACHLVSDATTTSTPFIALMNGPTHLSGYGLDVKLNDHSAHLQIDTGAGGITISRSIANRAGLKRLNDISMGGIGDQGGKAAYTAYADSIKVGGLEFRDCEVEVIDQSNVVDVDGLVGMDVFSDFLVTLDYPLRKLTLAPLPPRPDDLQPLKPSLGTSAAQEEEAPSTTSQTADAKSVRRGPRDRFVSPEMQDWTHVYRAGHNLLVLAILNKSPNPRLLILDTGAFATTVTPAVAREVTKVRAFEDITIKGISGEVAKTYTADEIIFRFGNLNQKVENALAFDTPQISRGLGMEIAGFVGITALGQTTMTIDYRDGLVKFVYDPTRGYKYNPTR